MNYPKLAASTLLALAAAAQSATVDVASSPFTVTVDKTGRAEFSDVFNFSFGAGGGQISGALIELKALDSVDIDWGDVPAIRIFGGLDATGPSLFVYGGPYAPALTVNFDHLAVPALFSVAITGRAIGAPGDAVLPVIGEYRLNVQAQPVPEPETVALMFAGLGVLGFVGTRRRLRG